jgi:hypothetical protein
MCPWRLANEAALELAILGMTRQRGSQTRRFEVASACRPVKHPASPRHP